MRGFRSRGLAVLLVLGLIVGQAGGVLAQEDDAPTITVGSLPFTESIILGEMFALMLENAGYDVERKLDLGVRTVTHEALVRGDIDMYVEYTGGGLVAILGLPVPTVEEGGQATPATSIAERTYATVSDAYREEFGLVWLDELGFNNAYALAVRVETAEALGLESISDLESHAGDMTLATDEEFADRQDGLAALEAVYGIAFAEVMPGDPERMNDALESGDADIITAYTTDGRLSDIDAVLLEDDRNVFPPYHAAPVVDQNLLKENPELEGLLNRLAGRIDDETMAEMNDQVDEAGAEPIDVARAFLLNQGILEAGD